MNKLKYIEIKTKKIYYLEWIPDAKILNGTVFCIHGINRNKRDFDYLAQDLCGSGFRVIAIDMPGRGLSDYLEEDQYNYPSYASFVTEFIEKVIFNQFIFIGTSMGGIIAMLVAKSLGSKIKGIVLNDIGPYTDKAALQILGKYLVQYPKFTNIKEATRYLKVLLRPLNIKDSTRLDYMIAHSLKKEDGCYVLDFDQKIFKNHSDAISADRDLWPEWEMIDKNMPILVLRGKQSKILSKKTLDQMELTKNNLQYIEYDNVGHTPSLVDQDQIEDVKKWLISLN